MCKPASSFLRARAVTRTWHILSIHGMVLKDTDWDATRKKERLSGDSAYIARKCKERSLIYINIITTLTFSDKVVFLRFEPPFGRTYLSQFCPSGTILVLLLLSRDVRITATPEKRDKDRSRRLLVRYRCPRASLRSLATAWTCTMCALFRMPFFDVATLTISPVRRMPPSLSPRNITRRHQN